MFTGIVQELGTVVSITRTREVDQLRIHAPKTTAGLMAGESVAINGVCVSAVRVGSGAATFELIPETHRLTNLGFLKSGARVNVERSLTLSDRLNGHLVLGHVDGMGKILRCKEQAGQAILDIQVDRRLRRYLVPKGPVALDGVSLTVGSTLSATTFSVYLIPETLRKTTLSLRHVGDFLNIEVDYFAKLLAQLSRDHFR